MLCYIWNSQNMFYFSNRKFDFNQCCTFTDSVQNLIRATREGRD